MIPTMTALLKTLTGKVLAGVIVATVGVGAAAAADVQVPVLNSAPADDDLVDDGDDEGTDDGTGDEAGTDAGDEPSVATFASGVDEAEGDGTEGDGTEGDGTEDEAEENHGQTVSEFTQSAAELGLTGCAKGQATAAVARGDVVPGDAVDETALLEALAPHVAKCGVDLLAEDDPEVDPEAALEGDEDVDWKATRDGDLDVARKEAQAAFDEICGDDDEGAEDPVGADGTDDDDEMSEECRGLKQAAKDARDAWKDGWKTERDAEHADRKADKPAKAEKQDKGNTGKSSDAPGKNK